MTSVDPILAVADEKKSATFSLFYGYIYMPLATFFSFMYLLTWLVLLVTLLLLVHYYCYSGSITTMDMISSLGY